MSEARITQLDTLVDADEDGRFSDGDEPFPAATGLQQRLASTEPETWSPRWLDV